MAPQGAFSDSRGASSYIRSKHLLLKMQQNYPVNGGYGTDFTTSVTSGYGTINPGPSSVPPFMGAAPRGEMMGTASDGSSLAAYAPIVHAMPTLLFPKGPKTFVLEGTLLRLYAIGNDGNSKTAHADCVTGDDFVLVGTESGVADNDTTFNVNLLGEGKTGGKTPFYRPTASGSHGTGTAGSTHYVDTISLALQSVTRVRLEGVRPNATETWPAGSCIYVHDDKTTITLKLASEGSKACLGVTTLPCTPANEEWVYLCLRPDLRAKA